MIPAAGTGQRATHGGIGSAGSVPKQYHRLLDECLLAHTLRSLSAVDALERILVVLAPGDAHFEALAGVNGLCNVQAQRIGGASRAESVRNGVQALLRDHGAQQDDWVLVHDAARCLVTPALVERLIEACQGDAVGGLLALPLPDTLKQQRPSDDGPPRVADTVPRSGKWLAHTPQMFRLQTLADALDAGDLATITDEASAIEAVGLSPLLVPSSAQNFKVTYPEDFALAEAVLHARRARTDMPL